MHKLLKFSFVKCLLQWFALLKWPRLQAVINGGLYYRLKEEDHDNIRTLLNQHYLIALTRRNCHFTTYVIAFASWFATGKMSHWCHALMNVEYDNEPFRLIEATGEGVHYSTFMKIFDVDSVVLLAPRHVSLAEWTLVMEMAIDELGELYDFEFDIADNSKVSCVELVYSALKKLPDFDIRFAELIDLIKNKNDVLTPQMLYDCGDLDVIFEVHR